jgi:hypothetical protein
MYNTKLTVGAFEGRLALKRGCRRVVDDGNYIICGISNQYVCDLNGKVIAVYSHTKMQEVDGEDVKVRLYESPTEKFRVVDKDVYVNDVYIGKIAERDNHAWLSPALIFLLLAIILALIALMQIPGKTESVVPVIEVRDNNGDWDAQGEVAVFSDTIHPGLSGEYQFIIRNSHDVKLQYTFTFSSVYAGNVKSDHSPLMFRLRMNNILLQDDEWHYIDDLSLRDAIFLPLTDQSFTLEWKWAFESGDDALDTLFGEDNGQMSLVLNLTAVQAA